MKKIFIFHLLLISTLFFNLHAQISSGWYEQSSGTSQDIRQVSFTSTSNGWAVVQDADKLLHTANGGENWSVTSTGLGSYYWNAIHFLDSYHGFVGGNANIARTSDGGNSWVRYNFRDSLSILSWPYVYDFFFLNAYTGWAVGTDGLILKTSNGGVRWDLQNHDGSPVTALDVDLECVWFTDSQNGWVAGDNGVIFHTSNGGTNWTVQSTPNTTRLYDITFTNATNGFAVGAAYRNLLVTTDGGTNWNLIPTTNIPTTLPYAIHFTSSSDGWISGYHFDVTMKGDILRTNDGGTTWYMQSTEDSDLLRHLFMVDSDNGWAVGASGSILRTATGGCLSPMVNLFEDKAFCSGESYTVYADTFSQNLNCSYLWNTMATTGSLTVTESGQYIVVATNLCGETASDTINLEFYPLPDVSAWPDTAIISGDTIDLNASGGVLFSWSPAGTLSDPNVQNPRAFPLSTTEYTVSVTDANGCINTDTVTVTVYPVLELSFDGIHISSLGGNDGSIDLTVVGGLPPYSYSWSNAAITEDLSGLSEGVFTVVVTDARDTEATDSIRIYDTFTDDRDGQIYRAITIGDQTWMVDNLNFYTQPGSWYYDDDSLTYAETYGRLFNWPALMDIDQSYATTNYTTIDPHRGVCPTGWHIPSDDEWKAFELELGMSSEEVDRDGLDRGTDEGTQILEGGSSGFEATLSGHRGYQDDFASIGLAFNAHTSTEYDAVSVWSRQARTDITGISRGAGGTLTYNKQNAYQVRCILDIDTEPLQIQITDSTSISCQGLSDGDATVSISGGRLPYSILWDDDASSTAESVYNLEADRWYHVTVTDANMVVTSDSVMLSEPEPLELTEKEYSSQVCINSSNGYINLTIAGGTLPYTFVWSDGSDTEDLSGVPPGIYDVIITDQNNCVIHDTTTLDAANTTKPEICLVTLSNELKNLIVWEQEPEASIKEYIIYREDIGGYTPISSVTADNLSIYHDQFSNPAEEQYLYKIRSVNICDDTSDFSGFHKTIHLSASLGLGNEIVLNWNQYEIEGETNFLLGYEIYRNHSTENLIISQNKIHESTPSKTSFTDFQPPSGALYYQVVGVKLQPCNPSTLKSDGPMTKMLSNIYDYAVGIKNEFDSRSNLKIYPNPFTDRTIIQFDNKERNTYILILSDLTGKRMKIVDNITAESIEISRNNLSKGLYLIEIRGPKIYRGKIVVE